MYILRLNELHNIHIDLVTNIFLQHPSSEMSVVIFVVVEFHISVRFLYQFQPETIARFQSHRRLDNQRTPLLIDGVGFFHSTGADGRIIQVKIYF